MDRTVRVTFLTLSTAIPLLALAFAAYTVRWPLLYALLGIGLGVIVSPVVQWLQRRFHIPRGLSALFILIFWIGVIGAVGYLIFFLVSEQFEQLMARLPALTEAVRTQLDAWIQRFPRLAGLRNLNLGGMLPSLGTLGHGLAAGIGAVGAAIYVIAISLYVATGRERYVESILTLFPRPQHARVRSVMQASGSVLRRWLVAQLIAMTAVGVCATIGFLIIRIEYWAVLGALTAVLDIIPFVGPTIAAACALLVTLGSDPSKAIWVLVVFVIVEHIESNLVVPLVLKDRIDLPPVQLLTLMLILTQWFGILGVLIAPPLLAVGRTIYLMVYVPSINSGHIEVDKKKAA